MTVSALSVRFLCCACPWCWQGWWWEASMHPNIMCTCMSACHPRLDGLTDIQEQTHAGWTGTPTYTFTTGEKREEGENKKKQQGNIERDSGGENRPGVKAQHPLSGTNTYTHTHAFIPTAALHIHLYTQTHTQTRKITLRVIRYMTTTQSNIVRYIYSVLL